MRTLLLYHFCPVPVPPSIPGESICNQRLEGTDITQDFRAEPKPTDHDVEEVKRSIRMSRFAKAASCWVASAIFNSLDESSNDKQADVVAFILGKETPISKKQTVVLGNGLWTSSASTDGESSMYPTVPGTYSGGRENPWA